MSIAQGLVGVAPERGTTPCDTLLWRAGLLYGMDSQAAAEFARQGILSFDDITVAVIRKSTTGDASDTTDNDLCIVCPMTGFAAQTPADSVKVLRANFMLASRTGFSIGSTSDDELHLIQTLGSHALDPARLAVLLSQCATLARAVQREFASTFDEPRSISDAIAGMAR